MKFGVILSAAAVLGLATVTDAKKPKPGPVKTGCTCSGSCSIVGDPHVRNWFNEEWIATEGGLKILKTKDVNIFSNVVGEYHFMTVIHFNKEVISAKDCDHGLPKSTFTAKGVKMQVKCNKPTNKKKYGDDWHLDIIDLKITANEGLAAHSEYSGVCVTHKPAKTPNPDDFDKVTFKNAPSMKCDCFAKCSVWGDPHIESFYGVEKLLAPGDSIDIYEANGFSVKAKVNKEKYMEEIYVNGKSKQVFRLSECPGVKGRNLRSNGGKVLGKFEMNVKNGSVKGTVFCNKETEGKKKGTPMLNFDFTKTDHDTTSAKDFHTMEQNQHAKGVCTLEKK
jgi:hypothetical protein